MKKIFISSVLIVASLTLTFPTPILNAQSTEMQIYLAQAEQQRIDSVYAEYMANNASLLRRTALLYLITNIGNGVTTANLYFQNSYFGSGSSNLLTKTDFRNEIDRINQFWAQVLSQYAGREILLNSWNAPLGGDPGRINRLVWINPDTLTVRVGPPTPAGGQTPTPPPSNTGTTGGTTGSYVSSISSVVQNSINQARNVLSRINNSSTTYLPTFTGITTPTLPVTTPTTGTIGGTGSTAPTTATGLQAQVNELLSIVQNLLAQLEGRTGSGSLPGGTTGQTGNQNLSTPGTGSGNCTILDPALSDSMKIAVTARNPYTALADAIPVSGNKVAPNSGIYMMSPLVEQYDGWAKINVNGVDYDVAGQNHDAYGLFHIVIPTFSVPDGTDITVKLYKSNAFLAPYTVLKTFKYYSTPLSFVPASSPLVMAHGSVSSTYNQPMTAKCGSGSVSWVKPVVAGGLPKGYDIQSNSITYNPALVDVKPMVGESYEWIVWGTAGGQDILQKFKLQIAQ